MDLDKILEESGAVMRGHFILSSGRHSDLYVEKFRIFEQPRVLTRLCEIVAHEFRGSGITRVAGPTTAGIIMAFEVARLLGAGAIYVESVAGKKVIRRGASLHPDDKVLVVDDVLTTGLSLKETIDAVKVIGGQVVATGVLIDRSDRAIDLGYPLFAAHRVEANSYAPDAVPAELLAIPPLKPGTRGIEPA